ncbi:MAG: FecR domain-containing protein [Bacteroidota bacterium]
MMPSNDSRSDGWVKKKIIDNDYSDDFSQQERLENDHVIRHTSGLKIDVEEGWNAVRNSIDVSGRPLKKSNTSRNLMRFAAAITLLIVAAVVVFNISETNTLDLVYETGTSNELIELKDGSTVNLNKNSKLIVDKDYNSGSRKMMLTGEALFSVKKDQNKAPFSVATDQGLITVLGTEFNVKTDQSTQVYVKHGKVSLSGKSSDSSIQLTKGELGTADSAGKLSKAAGNENMLFWYSNTLTFDGVELIDIVEEVNERLGTEITVNQNIAQSKLTLSFKGNTAEDFFKELKIVKAVEITQKGTVYHISDM